MRSEGEVVTSVYMLALVIEPIILLHRQGLLMLSSPSKSAPLNSVFPIVSPSLRHSLFTCLRLIVCSGRQAATQTEFNDLAAALGMTNLGPHARCTFRG
jgi:hypothetical protein